MLTFHQSLQEEIPAHYSNFGWVSADGRYVDAKKFPKAITHQNLLPPALKGRGEDYSKAFAAGWIRFMVARYNHQLLFNMDRMSPRNKKTIERFLMSDQARALEARSYAVDPVVGHWMQGETLRDFLGALSEEIEFDIQNTEKSPSPESLIFPAKRIAMNLWRTTGEKEISDRSNIGYHMYEVCSGPFKIRAELNLETGHPEVSVVHEKPDWIVSYTFPINAQPDDIIKTMIGLMVKKIRTSDDTIKI